jgi:hypothetical protein
VPPPVAQERPAPLRGQMAAGEVEFTNPVNDNSGYRDGSRSPAGSRSPTTAFEDEESMKIPRSDSSWDFEDGETKEESTGKSGKSRKIPNPLKIGKLGKSGASVLSKGAAGIGKGALAAGASGVSGGIGAGLGAVGGGASFLKGGNFQRKLKKNYSPEEKAQRALWRALLEKLDLLEGLPEEIEYAINALEVSDPCRAGDDVFRVGQKGDCIYFLMKGTCEARIDGQVRSLLLVACSASQLFIRSDGCVVPGGQNLRGRRLLR